MAVPHVIIGCGDVGRRIAVQLLDAGLVPASLLGLVQSDASVEAATSLHINARQIELDKESFDVALLQDANCFYLVPPQKSGVVDQRSRNLLAALSRHNIKPRRIVLISTTGVYGDCGGEWVTEQSLTKPQTERGQRRLDAEQQWFMWSERHSTPIIILRVPGIYANSRLPRQRIAKRIPVVNPNECGFSNRIHADDLVTVAIVAMNSHRAAEIYNATDGSPGKISEYLQAACVVLGEPRLPEISMQAAEEVLSKGMLSYLSESRKISNTKMLAHLDVALRYPNYLEGLKFG